MDTILNESSETKKEVNLEKTKQLKDIIFKNQIFNNPKLNIKLMKIRENLNKIINLLSNEELIELTKYNSNKRIEDEIIIKKNTNDWIIALLKIFIFRKFYINNETYNENVEKEYIKIFGEGAKDIKSLLEKHKIRKDLVNLGSTNILTIILTMKINEDNIQISLLKRDEEEEEDSDEEDSDEEDSDEENSDEEDSDEEDSDEEDSATEDSVEDDSASEDSDEEDSEKNNLSGGDYSTEYSSEYSEDTEYTTTEDSEEYSDSEESKDTKEEHLDINNLYENLSSENKKKLTSETY